MAVTWDDLSHFTWEEFDQLNLTWEDMENLSTENLLQIAAKRLKRFQELPPDAPMPDDLSQKLDELIEEVQELKEVVASQTQPLLPRRMAEGVFASLIANALSWAAEHPREIHWAIITAISIIDRIVRNR